MISTILDYSVTLSGEIETIYKVLMESLLILQNKAAKIILERATSSSATHALID